MNIKEFLLPDNLRPPALKDNWVRYLCMLVLVTGYYILAVYYSLWFSFDMMKETVSCFGIEIGKAGFFVSGLSFTEFANLAYLLCSAILGMVIIIIVLLIYGLKNFVNSLKGLKLTTALIYITSVVSVFLLASFIMQKTGLYSDGAGFSMNIYGKSAGAKTASFLAASLIIPLVEEFSFRFTFYQILRTKINFVFSALISSSIFGAMHYGYGSIVKVFLGLLAGTFFCWLYEKSKNILVPSSVHVLNNIANTLFM